jgi:hypothetical protein
MYDNTMINALLQKQNYTYCVLPHFVIFMLQILFMNLHHFHVLFEEEKDHRITAVAAFCLMA